MDKQTQYILRKKPRERNHIALDTYEIQGPPLKSPDDKILVWDDGTISIPKHVFDELFVSVGDLTDQIEQVVDEIQQSSFTQGIAFASHDQEDYIPSKIFVGRIVSLLGEQKADDR